MVAMNNGGIGTNTVTGGNTIKATAAEVTGKSIIEKDMDISASTLGSDILGAMTTITGALDSTDNKEFTAAAKLSDATITAGGSGTVTACGAVMPDGEGI